MYKVKIEEELTKVVNDLGFKPTDILVYISENVLFGDYTSNIALQLSKQDVDKNYQSPRDIANAIVEKFGHPSYLERINIAGPGFINFYLKDDSLIKILGTKSMQNKIDGVPDRVLVEFSQPNTHKAFHIGHLRNLSTGESLSRLLEFQGKEIFRVTYGGDIGPHVAKALWGVKQLNKEYEQVKKASLREKAEFLGKAYALGATSYEDNAGTKVEIDQLNSLLYQYDKEITPLWNETKEWSIAYFESIYARLGTLFDIEIWESEVQELGAEIVNQHTGDIFIQDQGAIIFPGEKYGLHNRVFITSAGYPTYEAKEIGLALKEYELFPFDKALHVVANEQSEYFKVLIKVVESLETQLISKKTHIPYGMVNLISGKMSSRKGEVITAENLINEITNLIKKTYQSNLRDEQVEKIAVAAIKYSFLKVSKESDISFDMQQSISLHGDSGPYLLYTYARINSILEKALVQKPSDKKSSLNYEPEEREVLRQLEYFDSVAERAANEYSPNDVATYLLILAKVFNTFYEKYPVLGSAQEEFRLKLSTKVAETIKLGCYLLGFEVLDKM